MIFVKKLLIVTVGIVALFAAVARAGVTEPMLLLGGRIRRDTVPAVKSYSEAAPFDYYIWGIGPEIRIDPKHWADKPVPEGTVPTARDGLMNPDKPVVVSLVGDYMSFHFDYYNYDGCKMRVIDINGNTLGTVTEETNPIGKPLMLDIPNNVQQVSYYVEINDGDSYSYLLVEVEHIPSAAGKVPQTSQPSQASLAMSKKSPQELMKLSEELEKYMKQNNIRDGSSMNRSDLQTIIDRTNKSLGYKAFDVKDFWSETEKKQNSPKSTPAKKSAPAKSKAKSKRTKKSK